MISIRMAGPEDMGSTMDLIQSIFPEAAIELSDEDTVLLAERAGKAIGFAHLIDLGDRFVLQGLGVKPSHRGYGIGSMLLDHAMDIVEETGRPMYLKTKSLNPAISLYERYGFQLKRFGSRHVLVRRPFN